MDHTKRDPGSGDAGARRISSDKHRRGLRIGSSEQSKSETQPLLRAPPANLFGARDPGLRQRLADAVIERQGGRKAGGPR